MNLLATQLGKKKREGNLQLQASPFSLSRRKKSAKNTDCRPDKGGVSGCSGIAVDLRVILTDCRYRHIMSASNWNVGL